MHSYTFEQNQSLSSSTNNSTSAVIVNSFISPVMLVSYTLLAFYCNAVLNTAFNNLRLCYPLSIVKIREVSLMSSLYKISKILFVYYNFEKVTLTKLETEQFLNFLNIYATILILYMKKNY
ncbi:unnamed protein product [Didymodactylos carnosus]|uniref:Conserved oligomeric Golgi complex subunit 8 n=1 Tax=Didymodactylos carnosus TaxID=1234261 RepID=A0A8S2D317_9BILA|nr:unnamed protein product [Didymodactylos carnosus]CAF3650496.1 unnamed protein product [Didymodactylos carnosus]